jgi:hypothetical protein
VVVGAAGPVLAQALTTSSNAAPASRDGREK